MGCCVHMVRNNILIFIAVASESPESLVRDTNQRANERNENFANNFRYRALIAFTIQFSVWSDWECLVSPVEPSPAHANLLIK